MCLARAFLQDTRLVVMDEATSSIDLHTVCVILITNLSTPTEDTLVSHTGREYSPVTTHTFSSLPHREGCNIQTEFHDQANLGMFYNIQTELRIKDQANLCITHRQNPGKCCIVIEAIS